MDNTLVMDRQIVWDSTHLKEVDEAKKCIRKYRAEGYRIEEPNGNLLKKFKPHLERVIVRASKIKEKVMKVLSSNGDDRITWDKENGPEAKEAKAKFEELIEKGYTAFSVDTQGKKNNIIEEFDIDAEEILLIPATSKG
jgi:hypothetical protein